MTCPPALDQRDPDLDASLTTGPDLLSRLVSVLLVGKGYPADLKAYQEGIGLLFAGLFLHVESL